MGTFEDVLYKAKAVAETAGKKTGELVDQMRLKVDLTAAEIAAAGVYLHAKAGDLAAAELGEYGMLPSDLIDRIPLICKDLSDSRTVIS